MATRCLQGDVLILDAGPGTGIAQQTLQLAGVVAMDQLVDAHAPEFLGMASGKHLGRAGSEGDLA